MTQTRWVNWTAYEVDFIYDDAVMTVIVPAASIDAAISIAREWFLSLQSTIVGARKSAHMVLHYGNPPGQIPD